MKTKYALIIISGVMLFCYACTKTKNVVPVVIKSKSTSKTLDTTFTTTPVTASIIGKWYINKARLQVLTTSTGAVTDTTYTGSAFNADSYYQFNSDSTATFSQNASFFTSEVIQINGTQQIATRLIFLYNVTGSILTVSYKYGLPWPSAYNSGPYSLDIVQLDANTLVLHGINSDLNGSSKAVLDVSLTRAQ
ncbi:MAG: hypothetical protein ACXVP6_16600 [Bacteroidia bacterium]